MPRVKNVKVTRARRKKVLKLAKGYFGSKHTLYKTAHEQVMRSLQYAYRDRRQTKRNFRKLWISRINAAAQLNGIKYSKFVHGLSLANVALNRKVLADMAVHAPEAFAAYADLAKDAIKNPDKYADKKTEKPAAAKVDKKAPKVEKKVEKAEEKVVEKKTEVPADLSKLTVPQLKELAKTHNIAVDSKLKKAELIEVLEKATK